MGGLLLRRQTSGCYPVGPGRNVRGGQQRGGYRDADPPRCRRRSGTAPAPGPAARSACGPRVPPRRATRPHHPGDLELQAVGVPGVQAPSRLRQRVTTMDSQPSHCAAVMASTSGMCSSEIRPKVPRPWPSAGRSMAIHTRLPARWAGSPAASWPTGPRPNAPSPVSDAYDAVAGCGRGTSSTIGWVNRPSSLVMALACSASTRSRSSRTSRPALVLRWSDVAVHRST
jgi:hypothetical protein